MADSLADRLIRKSIQAAELYHRLVLLVAPDGLGKTAALQEVHERTAALKNATRERVEAIGG